MKLSLSILSLFLSATALATPKVGDFAEYNFNQVGARGVLTGTISREITEFNGSNYHVVQTTVLADGTKASNDSWDPQDNFVTDEQIEQTLQYCTQIGGALENLQVAAGAFSTCAVPVSGNDPSGVSFTGRIWVGKVSLGMVKMEETYSDGTQLHAELKSFH